jgi:hypothetical protein
MAYQISVSETAKASSYVNSLSRYKDSTVLTFSTYKRTEIPANQFDKYTVIPEGYAYRPDLVSNSVYGYPDSWWLIMQANNIYDIKDFIAGKTIRIPINNQ